MPTETIEGPARPIRCVVCNGRTVCTGSEMVPVGEVDANGARHFIPNPSKFMFLPGEELDLPPTEFACLHAAGFVRLPEEDAAVMRPGSLSFPSGGAVPVGNVKPAAGLN